MLDRAGDATCDVKRRGNGLSGLSDLEFLFDPTSVDRCTGSSYSSANDVWVAGGKQNTVLGVLFHYDGTSFTQVNLTGSSTNEVIWSIQPVGASTSNLVATLQSASTGAGTWCMM